MEKIEVKDIKIGDLLLIRNKKYHENKWIYKILKFRNNIEILVDRYKVFDDEDQIFERDQNHISNILSWDMKGWEVYKLEGKEIGKWKKAILIKAL